MNFNSIKKNLIYVNENRTGGKYTYIINGEYNDYLTLENRMKYIINSTPLISANNIGNLYYDNVVNLRNVSFEEFLKLSVEDLKKIAYSDSDSENKGFKSLKHIDYDELKNVTLADFKNISKRDFESVIENDIYKLLLDELVKKDNKDKRNKKKVENSSKKRFKKITLEELKNLYNADPNTVLRGLSKIQNKDEKDIEKILLKDIENITILELEKVWKNNSKGKVIKNLSKVSIDKIFFLYLSTSFYYLIKDKVAGKSQNRDTIYSNYKFELFMLISLYTLNKFKNSKVTIEKINQDLLNQLVGDIVMKLNRFSDLYEERLEEISAELSNEIVYGHNFGRILKSGSSLKIYNKYSEAIEFENNFKFSEELFNMFFSIETKDIENILEYIVGIEVAEFSDIYDIEEKFLNFDDKKLLFRIGTILELAPKDIGEYFLMKIYETFKEYYEKIKDKSEYNKIKRLIEEKEKVKVKSKRELREVLENLVLNIRCEIYKIYYFNISKNLKKRYFNKYVEDLVYIRKAYILIGYLPIINYEIEYLLENLLKDSSIRTVVLEY